MTKWRIPEDGVVDELAVTLAIDGRREVRLSPGELYLAVSVMTDRGYGAEVIATRLHLSWGEVRQIQRSGQACKGCVAAAAELGLIPSDDLAKREPVVSQAS